MPPTDVDAVEAAYPGYIEQKLASVGSLQIDAPLRKRYAAPFAQPYPEAVREWLHRIVTPYVYLRRGVDPNDQQYIDIREDGVRAMAEIKDAAEAQNGLYDLPLRHDTIDTGIVHGGPFVYSEASPYLFIDRQADEVRR
jgi:hypothetical protein